MLDTRPTGRIWPGRLCVVDPANSFLQANHVTLCDADSANANLKPWPGHCASQYGHVLYYIHTANPNWLPYLYPGMQVHGCAEMHGAPA